MYLIIILTIEINNNNNNNNKNDIVWLRSLCLSKLLITKLYIYMYLYVLYVKSNQSNHTN